MSGKKQNHTNNILVLVGPTSSGKTFLASALCKQTGANIISADSRQIFKHMDIGTGKVPLNSTAKIKRAREYWLFDGVKVYGYDLASPDQYFSVYDYAKFAISKINELTTNGEKIIIVGGTGFYIDILTGRKILDGPAPDLDIRKELEQLSLYQLKTQLKKLNRGVHDKIDLSNPARVSRALEKELSQQTALVLPKIQPGRFKFFGLTAPREYLYTCVDAWVEEIWNNGLLPETQYLMETYPDNLKLNGLVYGSAKAFLTKQLDKKAAIQQTKWDLHAYIRRQFTWFTKNKDINWLNISELSQKTCILKLQQL